MKIQRLLIALTIANMVMLVFSLAQPRQVAAQGIAPVLSAGRAWVSAANLTRPTF